MPIEIREIEIKAIVKERSNKGLDAEALEMLKEEIIMEVTNDILRNLEKKEEY